MGNARDFFRACNFPCRDQTALISRRLDEPLRPGTALGLRLHLLKCRKCSRYAAQIARLHTLAGRLGREAAEGAPMPPAVRTRVLRRLNNKN